MRRLTTTFMFRYRIVLMMGVLVSCFIHASSADESESGKDIFSAVELNHLSLNIEKVERAEVFYRTVFGMTTVSHGRRGADKFLHFQQGFLNMRPSDEAGINHFCLSIEDYNPDVVFQMSQLIETDPFYMGRSVHCYSPDRFNVQIQEAKHGWGRIHGEQLTDADKGLFKTIRIHHLSFNVKDLKKSKSFYNEVFGTELVSENDKRVLLQVKPSCYLELLKAGKAGINHYCFAVDEFDEKAAISKLKGHALGEISTPEEGVIRFNDPNGIPVEITSADHIMN